MTRNLKTCFAIALLSLVSATAQAGTFSLSLVPVNAYSPDFAVQLPAVPDLSQNFGSPIILEMVVRMDVQSLTPPERSFANTGFNINFGGDTEDAFDTGWGPDTRLGDSNGATPGGSVPLWFANTDAGVPGDEKGILVSIAAGLTGVNDNRRNIGQAPGSQGAITGTNPYPTGELGNFFVLWDGVGSPYNSPDADYVELADVLFQAADNAGVFLTDGTSRGDSVRLYLGQNVPEPGTIALAGLSLVGLVLRRRAA